MKVLLRSDVRGVGRRGDIVESSPATPAISCCFGAAMKASSNTESQASSMRKSRDSRDGRESRSGRSAACDHRSTESQHRRSRQRERSSVRLGERS